MMKLLLVALAFVPTVVALTDVIPDGDILHPFVITEYEWCCEDAKCWDACLALCEHGKDPFCVGGFRHPGSPDFAGGSGGLPPDILDKLGIPMEMAGSGGGDINNPFRDRRRTQVITGCGPMPTPMPADDDPENPLSDPVFASWFECYEEFYMGSPAAKAHCVRVLPDLDTCCNQAVCGGDPHFKTWVGEWYDYHSECDLNFIHAPMFAHGLGLDIHIRTKIRGAYSFIETASLRIGSDILEVTGFGQYMFNGVANADLDQVQVGAFELTHESDDEKVHIFNINVGDHKIKVKTFKDAVSIILDDAQLQDYATSVGLLGRFGSGILYGRDGKTVFTKENIEEFGQEWQVRPDEPQLFQNPDRAPQYPDKCMLPNKTTQDSRRLSESSISQDAAEKACSGWSNNQRSQCVYDVMATGDLEMADAGGY